MPKHPRGRSTSQPPGDIPMDDPPLREPRRRGTTRREREKLPTCGAATRSGKPCQNPAGHATDHPGEGRCRRHGGMTQIKGTRHDVSLGRYSDLQARPRLRDLIQKYTDDPQLGDLTHELVLLRAITQDYLERYDEITEALLAWHASHTKDFESELNLWRLKVAKYVERTEKYGREPNEEFPQIPYPGDFQRKPRQIIDIIAVSGLIDRIGGMSDRIEKRKQEGTVTLVMVDQILERMGMEVVYATQEVGIDDVARTALLAVIERRWGTVRIDSASGPVQGIEAGSRGPLH